MCCHISDGFEIGIYELFTHVSHKSPYIVGKVDIIIYLVANCAKKVSYINQCF